jgi:hypothetical protein
MTASIGRGVLRPGGNGDVRDEDGNDRRDPESDVPAVASGGDGIGLGRPGHRTAAEWAFRTAGGSIRVRIRPRPRLPL